MRWDNTSDDESDDEEKLREILFEVIPEYERKIKRSFEELVIADVTLTALIKEIM